MCVQIGEDEQIQSSKKEVMCSVCEKQYCVIIKVMENTLDDCKDMPMEEVKIRSFKCNKHSQKDIEFFCADDGQFFCTKCIAKHLVHTNNIKVNSSEELMAHYKNLGQKMDQIIEKAQSHKKHIDQVIQKKLILDSFSLANSLKELE